MTLHNKGHRLVEAEKPIVASYGLSARSARSACKAQQAFERPALEHPNQEASVKGVPASGTVNGVNFESARPQDLVPSPDQRALTPLDSHDGVVRAEAREHFCLLQRLAATC
jgi:hypothetical protein